MGEGRLTVVALGGTRVGEEYPILRRYRARFVMSVAVETFSHKADVPLVCVKTHSTPLRFAQGDHGWAGGHQVERLAAATRPCFVGRGASCVLRRAKGSAFACFRTRTRMG